jgi:hypothetical protein
VCLGWIYIRGELKFIITKGLWWLHILHVFWCFNQKRLAYRDARRYACVKFNLPASFHISRKAPPDTCVCMHTRNSITRNRKFLSCARRLAAVGNCAWMHLIPDARTAGAKTPAALLYAARELFTLSRIERQIKSLCQVYARKTTLKKTRTSAELHLSPRRSNITKL